MTLEELEKRIVMLEALVAKLRELLATHGVQNAKVILDKTESDTKAELNKTFGDS